MFRKAITLRPGRKFEFDHTCFLKSDDRTIGFNGSRDCFLKNSYLSEKTKTMANYTSTESSTGSAFVFLYGGSTADAISTSIEAIFAKDGYSIKSGDLGNRTYVKGNRVLRILLGAFYKYFECQVSVTDMGNDTARVNVRKTTSGMSGGLIGVNQVKKEFARLETALMLV